MTFKGEKVLLRPLKETDFEKYYQWHLDDIIRFQVGMHPFVVSERNEREWFENAIKDMSNKRVIFSIVFTETDELIGYFQLNDINFINNNASLGIVIGEKTFQGKGLGKEIIKIGTDYGFNNLGLDKISLDVVSSNERAINLYKKLGFVIEGNFINHFFFNGKYHDIVRMALFNIIQIGKN